MTFSQLFFSVAGLIASQTVILVLYINAKIDPFKSMVDALMSLVVGHEGRIGKLEGKQG